MATRKFISLVLGPIQFITSALAMSIASTTWKGWKNTGRKIYIGWIVIVIAIAITIAIAIATMNEVHINLVHFRILLSYYIISFLNFMRKKNY